MFFNAGTYTATNGANALTLNNGQSVWGRSANYSAPASSSTQPTFNGAFLLMGNNTIDTINLNNSLGASTIAILSNGGQNLLINNTNIGSTVPYAEAMNLVNASARLTQSNVNVAPQVGVADGILLSGSSLLVQSSNISVTNSSSVPPVGIFVTSNSSLTLTNSSLNVTNAGNSIDAIAIQVQSNSTALINGTAVAVNSVNQQTSVGFFLPDNTSTIEMNGGSLTVVGTGPSTLVEAFGSTPNISFSTSTVCTLNGGRVFCNEPPPV
jgi:hypothetical protein